MICLGIQINFVGLHKGKGNSVWNIRFVFFLSLGLTRFHLFKQHHMPVLPNLQKELEEEYRKTLPATKK